MAYIKTNGIPIPYEVSGPPNSGPLLLMHGVGVSLGGMIVANSARAL